MKRIDWRELYAANQEKIQAALGTSETMARASPSAVARALPTGPMRAGHRLASGPGGDRPLVHVPDGLDPGSSVALVCMLHGCTQDPATFAAATLMNDAADRDGFVVVYPGQDRGSNPQGCWNWFRPEHQQRGAGEPAAIAGIVHELIDEDARCTIDRERVFAAGLSSGGAMAAILAACYPELFTAVAVHSGLPYRSATDIASAFEVMAGRGRTTEAQSRESHAAMGLGSRPVASIVIHGSADRVVAPANAIEVLRQSMSANHRAAPQSSKHDVARPTTSSRSRIDGGHAYTRSQWLNERGRLMHELLEIDGLAHAWSGGAAGGSYTDPRGPSATEAICRFFSLTSALGVSGRA
jgi:poly(hydroxyalkanoate) depolymerase family esterase